MNKKELHMLRFLGSETKSDKDGKMLVVPDWASVCLITKRVTNSSTASSFHQQLMDLFSLRSRYVLCKTEWRVLLTSMFVSDARSHPKITAHRRYS
jgi:hypothetical protein